MNDQLRYIIMAQTNKGYQAQYKTNPFGLLLLNLASQMGFI
jgi:hypothetical protein